MQAYEIVTIFDPEIADGDLSETLEKIHSLITDRGGTIYRVQRWGRRKLAYPIKRYSEAHYVLTSFALDPKYTKELESDLLLAQEVLKHMIVKLDAIEQESSQSDIPPTSQASDAADTVGNQSQPVAGSDSEITGSVDESQASDGQGEVAAVASGPVAGPDLATNSDDASLPISDGDSGEVEAKGES